MGKIRNVWILAEGKQECLWKINLFGALLNVAINYLLIPIWGASGAAAASLMTQIFTNYVLGFVYPPIKRNGVLLLKGINPVYFAKMLANSKLSKGLR